MTELHEVQNTGSVRVRVCARVCVWCGYMLLPKFQSDFWLEVDEMGYYVFFF